MKVYMERKNMQLESIRFRLVVSCTMSTLCSDLSQIELAYSVAEQQMAKLTLGISLLDSDLASMCVMLFHAPSLC